jgi:ribosomal protein S18 acetylase RimI-like enzyme
MVIIRSFKPSDRLAIKKFIIASAAISWPGKKIKCRYILPKIGKKGYIKIAEIERKPIAFIWFSIRNSAIGKYGYIKHIFVEKKWRRKGIAKKLIKIAEKELKLKGIDTLRLIVTKTNRSGFVFAKKCGFKQSRIVMEKKI